MSASSCTLSSHLLCGLPTSLFPLTLPLKTLFGMQWSSILTMWPTHLSLSIWIYIARGIIYTYDRALNCILFSVLLVSWQVQISSGGFSIQWNQFYSWFRKVFHPWNCRQPTSNTELENTTHWLIIATYSQILTIISDIQLHADHTRSRRISDITNKELCSYTHPNSIIRKDDPLQHALHSATHTLNPKKLQNHTRCTHTNMFQGTS